MNNLFDHIIEEIDRGLKYSTQNFQSEKREYPAKNINSEDLNEIEKYHSAGLMRVNHSGEVAAQGLYIGHALLAKTQEQKNMAMTTIHPGLVLGVKNVLMNLKEAALF